MTGSEVGEREREREREWVGSGKVLDLGFVSYLTESNNLFYLLYYLTSKYIYICVCVCVCVYIYTCMCVCVYIYYDILYSVFYIYIYIYIYIDIEYTVQNVIIFHGKRL